MKKILTIAILLPLLIGNAQSTEEAPAESAFKAGEWFRFRIHYGIFNASYANVVLKNNKLNGKPVYHVVGTGRTTGLARLFFKVDDRYESYFDKETLLPYKFIRKIDEGGHTKDLEIDFNHEEQVAHINNKKHNKQSKMKVASGVQDLLSAFYYLRNNYNVSDLKKGQEITLDMLFDDDETFKFKLKYLGNQTIKTKFGKIACLKFRPFVQSGRVFKEQESLTLWVSNDKNKIPIRIKADLRVGSIKADLDAFKGLKHPFHIQFD